MCIWASENTPVPKNAAYNVTGIISNKCEAIIP